jgi:hypothetical protein
MEHPDHEVVTHNSVKDSSRRQQKSEFYGGLFVLAIIGAIWLSIFIYYRKDLDVLATSKKIEALVIGKKIGSGKRNPRLVYIRDGTVPIGVKTTARWYFETVIGQKTTLLYSAKHHEYRQPYHRTGAEKFMLWYIGVILGCFCGRMIWLAKQMWFLNNAPGSVDSNPG